MSPNNSSGDAQSKGNDGPLPKLFLSTNANMNQDGPEAHDDDTEIGTKGGATFPEKLMDALEKETPREEAADSDGGTWILAWSPTGDVFFVRDKASFEKYFKKCKFMSFMRKLYRQVRLWSTSSR